MELVLGRGDRPVKFVRSAADVVQVVLDGELAEVWILIFENVNLEGVLSK